MPKPWMLRLGEQFLRAERQQSFELDKTRYDVWRSFSLTELTFDAVREQCKDFISTHPVARRECDRLGREPFLESILRAIWGHVIGLRQENVTLIFIDDEDYPAGLRLLPDPPAVLTVLGNSSLLRRRSVAVVGSRRVPGDAVRNAYELGLRIADETDLVCVSGGAIGCDISVHAGVAQASVYPSPAVIVFAGGLSELFPKINSALFYRLLHQGACFVSEMSWHTPALPYRFPIRNRIIAALAEEIVVIAAGRKSGAMHTVEIGLELGKDVLVWRPPPRFDVRFAGSHALLEQGAIVFEDVDDYLFDKKQGASAGPKSD